MGGERATIALPQASKAAVKVVKKLTFVKGNALRGLGRDGGRKPEAGKWRPWESAIYMGSL